MQFAAILILGVGWSGIGLALLTDWGRLATRAARGPISSRHATLRGPIAWRISGGLLLLLGLVCLYLAIVGRSG